MTIPVVPPIEDADRSQVYETGGSTLTTLDLDYPLFGDADDLVISVDDVDIDPADWALTSISGTALAILPRPITDGRITFSPAIAADKTVEVRYTRLQQRASQPSAGGLARREYNKDISDIVATLRELRRDVSRSLRHGLIEDGDGKTTYNAGARRITNVGYPSEDSDVATKEYADQFIPIDSDLALIADANNGAILAATTASFLSADETKLDGIEAGAQVTSTARVESAGALMDSELADITAIKTFQAPDNTTISTFGATVVDDVDAATMRATLTVERAAFRDVATLLADTTLTYTTGLSGTVATGNVIRTHDGFAYEVAASGASDHDLTTAGSVKLYVQYDDDNALNVLAFGIAPSTSTDNGAALVKVFTKARTAASVSNRVTIKAPKKVFLSSQTLLLGSYMTIQGGIWGCHSSKADNIPLFGCNTRTGGLDVFANSSIYFIDCEIDGFDRTVDEDNNTQNLVRLESIDGVYMSGCKLRNHRRGLIQISGCKNVIIPDIEFDTWGFLAPGALTGDGGSAMFIGKNYIDETNSSAVSIGTFVARNGRWTGLSIYGADVNITSVTILDGMECGIYTTAEGGGGPTRNIVIGFVLIRGIRLSYIDAAGIVPAGPHMTIGGGIIEDCDCAGLSFQPGCNGFDVAGNLQIIDCVRDVVTFGSFASYGQILIRDLNGGTGLHNINLRGVTVRDNGSPKVAPHGISIYHASVSPSYAGIDGISIVGCDLRDSCLTAGNELYFEPELLEVSSNVTIHSNKGVPLTYQTQGTIINTAVAVVSGAGPFAETVLKTVSIPGGFAKPNATYRGTVTFTVTDTNTKNLRVRFGAAGSGIGGTLVRAGVVATTTLSLVAYFYIQNRNSRSVQHMSPAAGSAGATGLGTTTVASVTGAINMANDWEINITGESVTGAGTIKIEALSLELVDPDL